MLERKNDMKLVAAVAAASSLLQVAFLRGLMAVGGGNELILGALLCGYLLFIAAGARLWRYLHRPSNPLVLLAVFTAASILELVLLREIGFLFRAMAHVSGLTWVAGESVPIRPALWAAFLIGAPTSIAAGMLFPLAVSRSSEPGAVGRFYAAEAFGHVVGFLGVALALWLGASDVSVIVFTPVVALAGLPLRARLHAPVLAATSAALLFTIAPLEAATSDRGGLLPGKPFAVKSSPFREVALIGTPEEYTVYSDGRAIASYPPTDIYAAIMIAAFVNASKQLAVSDAPVGDILLITQDPFVYNSIAQSPAAKKFLHIFIYCVDSAALEFTSKSWEKPVSNPTAPPPTFVFGDPLATINNLRHPDIELVVIDLPDPLSISDNRYFTVEFQRALLQKFGTDVIVIERFALPAGEGRGVAESYVTQVYSTIKAALPIVDTFDDESQWVFLYSTDYSRIITTYQHSAVASKDFLVQWSLLPRHSQLQEFLKGLPLVSPDTLRHPTTFLKRLAIENAFDRPEAYRKAPRASRFIIPAAIALLPLLVLGLAVFGIAKTRPRVLMSLDAFSTGILSMGAEIVLLFAYQAARGMLYLFTAAAVAAFMAGFWYGSASASRLGTSAATRRLRISIWLPLAAALICLGFVVILPTMPIATEIVLVIIMLATGYACGNNLSLLPSAVSDEPATSGAIVNASDNFGAALGAAGVTLVLIPLVGLPLAIAYLISLKFVTAFALSFRK